MSSHIYFVPGTLLGESAEQVFPVASRTLSRSKAVRRGHRARSPATPPTPNHLMASEDSDDDIPLAILKTRLSESSPSSPQTIEDLIDLVDRALATQLQELALL